jgi:Na+/melibiose symporter-like transporter
MNSVAEHKLDKRLNDLLNQFEQEVKPYDRLSTISIVITPFGLLLSIFIPILIIKVLSQSNPFVAIVSGSSLSWIIGSIIATLCLTKLLLFYVDYKKHEISRIKYRPIAGICMCDLSHLRSHIYRMENAKTTGERLRQTTLVNYYKYQIGLQ